MKYLFLIVPLSIFLFSCKKNSTQKANTSSAAYFPNTVGDFWKYKVIDSLTNSYSFVEVNIIGTQLLPTGNTANVWTFAYSTHVDTNFVYQSGDTINFLESNSLRVLETYFNPLILNNAWPKTSYYLDSIKVIEQGPFAFSNLNFENAFLLKEQGAGPNYYISKIEWFCPNIGMLTKVKKEFDLSPVESTYWELVEYQLQ
ncbi:MAG: hypothetical protein ABI402_18865 [Ferruginibacter sp.]